MALSQSALLDLLEALNASDDVDVIRSAVQVRLQELIEAEANALIDAERHERTESRTVQRNGYRPRTLSTAAGDLELAIPKLLSGSSLPSLLERRRRIDQALFAGVMEACVTGTSVRKVNDLVKDLGADTGISKFEVSRICADLDAEVAAFADRDLSETSFPYVFLDATYCKARIGGGKGGKGSRVASLAVVVATGVSVDGRREVFGFAVGDSEDGAFWTSFLRSLKTRGLHGTHLVISDAHVGLKSVIAAVQGRIRVAALPRPLPAQRPRAGPQGLRGDGRRCDPHDLRPARRRARPRPARRHRDHARPAAPRGRGHAPRRRG